MTKYLVKISGSGIEDKHTHYEAHPFVGPDRTTVIIREDIIAGFKEKYGIPIIECERFEVEVDFIHNSQRVKECQYVFKPQNHLVGSIDSLDDVVVPEKK